MFPNDRVLNVVDVGPAHGLELVFLKSTSRCNTIGVEPVIRFHELAPNGIRYLQGNLSRLPLEDSSQDIILCHATLHHLPLCEDGPNIAQAISEIVRVLRPRGVASILTRRGSGKSFEDGRFFQFLKIEDLLPLLPIPIVHHENLTFHSSEPSWQDWLSVVLRKP